MGLVNNNKQGFINWYKNKLTKAQRIFFYVLIINAIGFALIIYAIIKSLMEKGQAFTRLDKFTNQSNVLLFIFSIFFVFFPKHSFMKNDKFLIATTVYILFTFIGYNFVLSPMKLGYQVNDTPFEMFKDLYIHFFNPIIFIICGFIKFVYEPNINLKKYHDYLIPGYIYPFIYTIYSISIPFVFNTHENQVYSVYKQATNIKDYPQIAWLIFSFNLFVYLPSSYFIIWFSAKKISQKYYLKYLDQKLAKNTIKFIRFDLDKN
ncbi:DUF1600 domain-containing protein [Mycoplasma sp. E35C]|uniref:DUF1600 domain-containing protein n=1 Tax=Mycoplasma sp. E35C TaxID=2801918 RepID=UPI001CA461FE|nr:DUF1600 domain-containing protein [Mycoplasma sp. E35C]QZX48995.1 DUF1600 domain-containing protein [Mycoplasma sp. E35C]